MSHLFVKILHKSIFAYDAPLNLIFSQGKFRNVTNVVNLNVNRSFNRFPSFKEETLDIHPQTYHHSLVIASKRGLVQNKICGDGNGICNTKLN